MPKVGGEVTTPDGKAYVVSVNMLTLNVKVKQELKDGSLVYKDYVVSDLKFAKNNQSENDGEKLSKEEMEALKSLTDE